MYVMVVFTCRGCCNKAPHTGQLREQESISSEFRRLGVETRVSVMLVPSKGLREASGYRLSLACWWPSSP